MVRNVVLPGIVMTLFCIVGLWMYDQELRKMLAMDLSNNEFDAEIPTGQMTLVRTSESVIGESGFILIPPPMPKEKPAVRGLPQVAMVAPIISKPVTPFQISSDIVLEQMVEKPIVEITPPRVLGVVVDDDRAWALLVADQDPSGQWVTIGDKFQGWVVKSIEARNMTIERGKRRETIQLKVQ